MNENYRSFFIEHGYYPFGMLMPERNFSYENYRFGFNGQEKVDEVSGAGNHNTALFWEYDTRLGRRWNTDPVIKPWISPYGTFSLNPIIKTDINGDDDYFNRFGMFLGSDGSKTNNIRVISNTTLPKNLYTSNGGKMLIQRDIGIQNSKLLADFTYSKDYWHSRGNANNLMLSSVATFYANQVGITEYIGTAPHNESLAFTSRQINISIDNSGMISPILNDASSLKNTLFHEYQHFTDQSHDVPISFYRHAQIYSEQAEEVTYLESTIEFKQNTIDNFAYYLYGAIQKELISEEKIRQLINTYNSANKNTGFKIIDIDSQGSMNIEQLRVLIKTPNSSYDYNKSHWEKSKKTPN